MKAILVIVSLLVLSSIASAQINAPDQPQPQAGEQGWVRLNTGTTANLNRVFMFGPDTAWVMSETNLILFTTDAGQTWVHRSAPDGYEGRLFTAPIVGYAARPFANSMVKTTDGGLTWGPPFSGSEACDYMQNIGQDSLWGLSKWSGITRSTDAGKTWGGGKHQTYNPWHFHFRDSKLGIIVGEMFRSPEPPYTEYGTLAWTNDGAKTWNQLITLLPFDLYRVNVIDYNTFYLLARTSGDNSTGRFIRTSSGGKAWDTLEMDMLSGIPAAYLSMYFINKDQGVMVGTGGQIIRTEDAGRTWRAQASGVRQGIDVAEDLWLTDVAFANDSVGMAVGDRGTIVRTTNGGKGAVTLSDQQFRDFAYRIEGSELQIDITLDERCSMECILSDVSGREMLRRALDVTDARPAHLSVSLDGLATGTYFLKLMACGKSATGKINFIR